jgi:HEAT repeat protein
MADHRDVLAGQKELVDLGEPVRMRIKKALDRDPKAERKKRLENVLASLVNRETSAEDNRRVRAVELLERIGTEEAKAVLVELAKGKEDDEAAREAHAAIGRMSR